MTVTSLCELAADKQRSSTALEGKAAVTATYESRQLDNEIVLATPLGTRRCAAPGRHNVANALAASAAASRSMYRPRLSQRDSRICKSGRLQRQAACMYNADRRYLQRKSDSLRAAIACSHGLRQNCSCSATWVNSGVRRSPCTPKLANSRARRASTAY